MITKISYEKGEKPNKHTLAPNEYFYNAKDEILYSIGKFGEVIEIGKQDGTISNFTSTGIDDNATSTAITIDASENVGIGTNAPSSKLHIKQTVDTINGGIKLDSVDGTHLWSIDSNNAGNLRIYKNGSPIARFNSLGNFGLGTTAPTEKLDVAGNIKASGTLKLGSNYSLRNVNNWRYASGANLGAEYIHMKTDRPLSLSKMFSVTFRGHCYAESKPINASLCWYNYAPYGYPVGIGFFGTNTCGAYVSADGYVVMTLYITNHYYVSFTYDQFTTNQGLQPITITAVKTSGSATGAY